MEVKSLVYVSAFVFAIFFGIIGFVIAFDSEVKGSDYLGKSYVQQVKMELGDLYKFQFGGHQYNLVCYKVGESAGLQITPGTWKQVTGNGEVWNVDLDEDGKDDIAISVSVDTKAATLLVTQLALVPPPAPVVLVNETNQTQNPVNNTAVEVPAENSSVTTENATVNNSEASQVAGSSTSYTMWIVIGVIVVVLVVAYIFYSRRSKIPTPKHPTH